MTRDFPEPHGSIRNSKIKLKYEYILVEISLNIYHTTETSIYILPSLHNYRAGSV